MIRNLFRLIASIGLACLLLLVVALVAGSIRYGGPSGLWRRAQAEVASWQPHPVFVPTPLSNRVEAVDPALARLARVAPQRVEYVVQEQAAAPTAGAQSKKLILVPTSTPHPTPSPAYAPAAPMVELSGLRHAWQTWNNCGPATLATYLSYFGSSLDQGVIGAALRSHDDDKNVLPEELAAYAEAQGYHAHILVNGSSEQMRLLVSNGLPVLVETWHEDEPNNGMGHYRLLTGYDDAAQHWIAYDSYDRKDLRNPDPNGIYQGIHIPYAGFDQDWEVFNRTYVFVYPDAQAELVQSILGADLERERMWQRALQSVQATLQQQPNNAFAWFNLGSDLVALGDYESATVAYDRARQIGLPWRMLWYQFGPFQAYYESGRYAEVLALADATIRTTASVEETFYWRGMALAAQGDLATATVAWQQALKLNPQFFPAREALGQ